MPGSVPYPVHGLPKRQLSHKVKEMRSGIYRHMLATRGWKYRAFLRYLRIFKVIALAPRRGAFLESYYTLMRYLDDITDGDLPLVPGYPSAAAYLEEKIAFALHPNHPRDEADWLMIYCFELATRFGADFQEETADILHSLLFDARRRGTSKFFPEAELQRHFHRLDIRGTIRATLKIFRDDPEKYHLLEPLGTACRYQYDIEDIDQDLAAGYINMSLEDAVRLGLAAEVPLHAQIPELQAWLRLHAEDGMKLLEKHRQLLSRGRFTLLEKAVFRFVYERPARKVFKQILIRS